MDIKKLISIVIVAIISVSLLAGCGKPVTEAVNDKPGMISNKQLNLTIYHVDGNSGAFKDDWKVFKKAFEMTNVKLKGIVPQSNSDAVQAFNIMMASGELADIIYTNKSNFEKYSSQDGFTSLDDLVEKYAPNIKSFFEKNPWAKKSSLTSDGKLYFIPYIQYGEAAEGWFIRQDWLKNLNLEVPKTVDEYYRTLIAFKENDPNKNGKKDEIPYFNRNGSIKSLFPLFGVRTDWYVKDDQVVYPKYSQEYKNAVINIAKWYKEGLIDKEIFTRGSKARDFLLTENLGGSTHDWFSSSSTYNDSLKEKITNFELNPIAPPADINGKVWEDTGRKKYSDMGWGIAKSNKYPIETIKYFDFWFGEEGKRLYNFGIEGVHYTMVDGKPKFTNEILHGSMPTNALLWKDGAQIAIGTEMDAAYEEQWTNPIAMSGVKMYVDNKYIMPEYPSLAYTPEERKVISAKWPSIDSYISETEQKWILGGIDVESSFNDYIKNLKDMGMDEVLKVKNDAYMRYKQ